MRRCALLAGVMGAALAFGPGTGNVAKVRVPGRAGAKVAIAFSD
jgi:hypothetical protein